MKFGRHVVLTPRVGFSHTFSSRDPWQGAFFNFLEENQDEL